MPASRELVEPTSAEETAEALHSAGRRVRTRGAGTKLRWGRAVPEPDVELSTERLDAIVEHNAGDFTAIVQAGAKLADAQRTFAEAGQMLALDPCLGAADGATLGGVVATADAGPLRHRYGAARDLVLGVQVALPDGKVARAGSRVIKNVAGYDLAKLFSGSFGTLGVIVELSVRLHPQPHGTASARARSTDPQVLARGASALAHEPLEHICLDVGWDGDDGTVVARFAGSTATQQARAAIVALAREGIESDLVEDDGALWDEHRSAQRSAAGTVLRVSATQTRMGDVLSAARRHGARTVGRAANGIAWLTLPEASAADTVATVAQLRAELAPAPCVVLDTPDAVREALDPWGEVDSALFELTRRVKERFDPARTCNPGLFLGGL